MPDEIDEVALNTLLASGTDLPTAWEASRRDSSDMPPTDSSPAVFYAVVLVAMVLALVLLLG